MTKLQVMANEISKWANNNSLSIHPGKSKIIIISAKKIIGPLPEITLEDKQIEIVDVVKCLGIKIDNKLLWSNQVKSISKQFSAKVKNLYQMRSLSSDILSKIYLQGIFPSVIYGISVWGNCCNSMMEELEHIHRKAVRFINRVPKSVPDSYILEHVGWKSVYDYYKKRIAVLGIPNI